MQPLSGKGLWAALPCRIHSANEPIITGLIFGKNPATKKTVSIRCRVDVLLQHTTTHCNLSQHIATNCSTLLLIHRCMHLIYRNTLQHTATYCNTLLLTTASCT
mmetsp:Transcript_37586/g.55212  ORF Transcript_37586/g.55212 Transcript_37586/m.55212 type:complete len:104 (-) Transcript_37586:31-342(-)